MKPKLLMVVHICDFSSWGHTEANDCQDFALFLLDFNAFQMLEPEMKRGENIHLCFPYKSEDTYKATLPTLAVSNVHI